MRGSSESGNNLLAFFGGPPTIPGFARCIFMRVAADSGQCRDADYVEPLVAWSAQINLPLAQGRCPMRPIQKWLLLSLAFWAATETVASAGHRHFRRGRCHQATIIQRPVSCQPSYWYSVAPCSPQIIYFQPVCPPPEDPDRPKDPDPSNPPVQPGVPLESPPRDTGSGPPPVQPGETSSADAAPSSPPVQFGSD